MPGAPEQSGARRAVGTAVRASLCVRKRRAGKSKGIETTRLRPFDPFPGYRSESEAGLPSKCHNLAPLTPPGRSGRDCPPRCAAPGRKTPAFLMQSDGKARRRDGRNRQFHEIRDSRTALRAAGSRCSGKQSEGYYSTTLSGKQPLFRNPGIKPGVSKSRVILSDS